MNGGRHISEEDLALHAMQALSGDESAGVRLHLAECAECRRQLAEITGDLALVAAGVEQHTVPEGARQRFIERMGASKAGTSSQDVPVKPARTSVVTMPPPKRASRPVSRIPWIAIAALLILSTVLGVRVYFLDEQLQTEDALLRHDERLLQAHNAESMRAHALLEVLTAPTAQRVTLTTGKTPPAPAARAVYLASRGALILQASNMQPLPPNKTYELWVIPMQGAPIPAGTFRPDTSGSGSVVMPPMIPPGTAAKAFAITIENEGGASTPTMPIVLSGAAPTTGE